MFFDFIEKALIVTHYGQTTADTSCNRASNIMPSKFVKIILMIFEYQSRIIHVFY